ncbi:MAG: T9SS type A sorting domain-containing protein, partial [Chitinophagaceae bacterium]|nr:T9SS type A sorting domain-containing protein [Chitinophagaceae bacterium]
VTNSCGADTVLHTIAVMPLPAIMMQPNDMAVSTGSGSSYFTILTTGSGISYQWLENRGSGFRVLSDSGQYSGTNTNMLTISNTYSAYNGWQFRCILSTVNCSDTSATATLYVWPLEVDDSSISVISISPNPTSGTVTVTSSAIIEQLTLTDLLGKQVLSQTGGGKTVHADMSSLAAGVYIIKVNGSVAGRVVRK